MDETMNAAKVQQEEDSAAVAQRTPAVYRNLTLVEAESFIEGNLVMAARAYVANGYFLKRIRDDRLYEEAGYVNFDEYVQAKYGKKKDWASRCIKVNTQLSVNGDSPNLDSLITHEEYMATSMAMLSVCDGICMMQGWENSEGCRLELDYAQKNGYTVMYITTDDCIVVEVTDDPFRQALKEIEKTPLFGSERMAIINFNEKFKEKTQ